MVTAAAAAFGPLWLPVCCPWASLLLLQSEANLPEMPRALPLLLLLLAAASQP
jgi:hypothetical protein